MYTLITGASGFIGTRLAQRIASQHPVIRFSRNLPEVDEYSIAGEFHALHDLHQLDKFSISCVVHLGAVTGGCSEEDGLAVNVLGTRRLLRYLADRGCRKFLLASSIAAVGCLDPAFVPLHLPITEAHPCLARDAYGFSKSVVEDLTRYFSRVHPDLDFTNFRFGVVVDETTWTPPLPEEKPHTRNPFAHFARVMLDDVTRALSMAIDAPHQPGVKVYNIVGPDTSAYAPVPDLLKSLDNPQVDQLDQSWYSTPEMLFSLYASFTKWDGVHTPSFIGLTNYIKMFTADPDFYGTIARTFYYSGGRVIIGVGLALILASLINQKIFGRTFFRAVYYLPTVVTGVPIYIVWSWMFDPTNGIFNYLLGKIGIQGPLWLARPAWAMPALIVMSLTSTGGAIVIFLAGLQGVPRDLYEAASVDGAGILSRFRNITLPMLSPIILFNVILGIIGALQVFAEPYVMTGGGPVNATYVYGLYLYNFAFQYFDFGYASGLAWVLFIITIVLSLLILAFSRGRVFYMGGEAK